MTTAEPRQRGSRGSFTQHRPQSTKDSPQTERYDEFTTVDWVYDTMTEKARALAIRRRLATGSWLSWLTLAYEAAQAWIVTFLAGAFIGLDTAMISVVTEWLSDLKIGYCSTAWWLNEKFCCWENEDQFGSCDDWHSWSYVLTGRDFYIVNWILFITFATAIGWSCAYLVREYSPYAAGSGLPEIKATLCGFIVEGFMGGWTLLIKSIGLAMNPFRTGKLVMFQVKYDQDWHFFEIIFFVILGIFGGLYGALVTHLNVKVARFRKLYLKSHAVKEVTLLATGTAFISFTNMFLRLDMGELLSILLQECKSSNWGKICDRDLSGRMIWLLAAATVLRTIGTIVAYGCKIPCGIFVPSMAIGATFGRMLGIIVQMIHTAYPKSMLFSQCPPDTPCITPATYALLGASAALCGVTKVTVAVVVIMYELTGALNYIVPTMIVVMVAKVVGDYFVHGGISEQLILLNGIPFFDNEATLPDIPIKSLMKTDLVVITSGLQKIRDIENILEDNAYQGFPIVSSKNDMVLSGYITRRELEQALEKARSMSAPTAEVLCRFGTESSNNSGGGDVEPRIPEINSSLSAPNVPSSGPYASPTISDQVVAPSSSGNMVIDLSQWVDVNPMRVDQRMPAATVLEIFRKLGPRAIHVMQDDSILVGFITRKDILRSIFHCNAKSHSPIIHSTSDSNQMFLGVRRSGDGSGLYSRNWSLSTSNNRSEDEYIELRQS
ncbi:glycerol ethanol, ferric requiring protein [Mycoemilia scoparia]|uniref:Glycerol ethanol, ferric requiring protein n=1 Tax=Mycoemilia scoparia TaxID=417184 RepID=A0A9W8DQM7_9FUNG|nr:glycerol ethanol, ferric requiring protein [Mycoemilia scoparia]